MNYVWVGQIKLLGAMRIFATKKLADKFLAEDPDMHYVHAIPLEEEEPER